MFTAEGAESAQRSRTIAAALRPLRSPRLTSWRLRRLGGVLAGWAEADGEALRAGDEGGGQPFRRAYDLEVVHPGQHLRQDGVDLDAGQMLAKADVRAAAEGDVLVRVARQIERVGPLELGRVAVGGAEVHDDLVARLDRLIAEPGVLLRRATHVDDRAGVA